MRSVLGKKSRLKRERRTAKPEPSMVKIAQDSEFESTCDQLRSVFTQYSAEDVMVSLSVSDLWLPNISSQVKHALAYAVAISMPVDSFRSPATIESYADFRQLIEQVYAVLPSFPMLEDYVPEPDWGEVKFPSNGSLLRIFYGGAVERISDFITAFHLVHGANAKAIRDMHLSLSAQHHVLEGVPKGSLGIADDIERGHVEPPSEAFWQACRDAILSLSTRVEFAEVSQGLVVRLGVMPAPKRRTDFSDAVMTGSALPAFLVVVGGRYFPLALRNAAATVIQHWSEEKGPTLVQAIGDFVSARFRNVIKGPLRIVTRTDRQPFIFSAVIMDGPKPHLIIALGETQLAQLPRIEHALAKSLSSGDWALQPIGFQGAMQIRSKDGVVPTALEQLQLVVVVARVTTVPGVVKIPISKAQVLPLSDFVTIFDSIEDIKELARYWKFVDAHSSTIGGFSGPADRFAAFRDSNAVLIDGAMVPTMIALDPHWGSNWRHKMLTKYWENAPPSFPNVKNSAWNVERDPDGLFKALAKRVPALSWSTVVGNCVVHFMLVADDQAIAPDDGHILELLIHCLADVLNQRKSILAGLSIFKYRQIVTTCRARMDSLVTLENEDRSELPIFTDWQIMNDETDSTIDVIVQANLQHVQKALVDVTDASFEVALISAWIEGVSAQLDLAVDTAALDELRGTSSRKPRFTTKIMERIVDVPDHASPHIPAPEHYKIARRDLAIAFKDLGAKEGRYELATAKALIDSARDNFRVKIHSRISLLRRTELIRFCIEQLDALTVEYDHKQTRIQMSLTHEVGYDRTKSLAEAHDQFVSQSRNYRYLLECCHSMPVSGAGEVSVETIVQLVASIDWLLTLYNASDVLHNGLDVAGLELDQFFIPRVYYTDMDDSSQLAFASEAAELRLGVGLMATDEVRAIQQTDPEWSVLDQAFNQDVGLTLTKLLTSLTVLSRWASAIDLGHLHLSYSASQDKIRDVLVESVKGMTTTEAEKFIALVSLDQKGIRRLLGKYADEGDVPLWEHNKRGDRYTIKPLIHEGDHGNWIWGAASMERAARIWRQTLANGYMPADYDWPNVKNAVRDIKTHLEQQLEAVTLRILLRATPYAEGGIDFRRRFSKESFDDVGDYDGLAYWPAMNQWVSVECKYNQPAFCLKDARRLRDRIFGTPADREQFGKIERRRTFLHAEMDRMRTVLGWPLPPPGLRPIVHELYVSRDIYWWMRRPPYPVPTRFLRIDGLDRWLQDNGLRT